MTRKVDILIGRLVADGDFRQFYIGDPSTTVLTRRWDPRLSDADLRGFAATAPAVWDAVAGELEARLQRARAVRG